MPTPKFDFPMALWKERRTLFTLGGRNRSFQKEVQEYSLSKSKWKLHSLLPEALYGSSAVVLDQVMYNIGGLGSSHSVVRCHLSPSGLQEWKLVDLPNYNFIGYSEREAVVVENKIVYFGFRYKPRTFVLEIDEQSDEIKCV